MSNTTEKAFYVQKGKIGFYSDSEWDGDSFCEDPFYAIKRTEPWAEGRGNIRYQCVKVILSEINHGKHLTPDIIAVQCAPKGKKQLRWKCKCPRCGASTKNYADIEMAKSRYSLLIELSKCNTRAWRYAEHNSQASVEES